MARSKWTVGLFTTTFAAALYMAQPDPTVRAAVGSHLGAVREASSYGFDFDDMDDNLPLVVEEPVEFEYDPSLAGRPGDADSLAFALPPGRFVWINQEAARVYNITVSPQLESLSLEETYERCQEVVAAVAAAPGWQRVGKPTPSAEVLRAYYASDPVNRNARLAEWGAGNVKLTLGIKRSAEVDREYPEGYPDRLKATEDRFIIDVEWYDSDLFRTLSDLTYARRRAAGDELEPLPIQVWLDDPDWTPDSGRQP